MPDNPETLKRPAKGDDGLDREFRQAYFKQLVGQFSTVGAEVTNEQARKQGEAIAKMDIEKVEWDDIYQLELAIIKLEPEAQARRRAWALRSEYENVASKEYAKYLKSNPPDPDKDPIDKVRADSVRIQEELNWYYTVLWVQESFRSLLLNRITKRTLQYFGGYLGLGVLLITLSFLGAVLNLFDKGEAHTGGGTNTMKMATNRPPVPTNVAASLAATNSAEVGTNVVGSGLANGASSVKEGPLKRGSDTLREALPIFGTYWLVVFAGTLGALVSILRRIQAMSLDGNSDLNLVQLERNSASIDFSPLLGAIFALLLLFLFMSGLLSGALFPEPSKDHTNVFLGCVPGNCSGLAKLVVWSFIAGFAEKFVPDALDKLQSRSGTAETAPPSK